MRPPDKNFRGDFSFPTLCKPKQALTNLQLITTYLYYKNIQCISMYHIVILSLSCLLLWEMDAKALYNGQSFKWKVVEYSWVTKTVTLLCRKHVLLKRHCIRATRGVARHVLAVPVFRDVGDERLLKQSLKSTADYFQGCINAFFECSAFEILESKT